MNVSTQNVELKKGENVKLVHVLEYRLTLQVKLPSLVFPNRLFQIFTHAYRFNNPIKSNFCLITYKIKYNTFHTPLLSITFVQCT